MKWLHNDIWLKNMPTLKNGSPTAKSAAKLGTPNLRVDDRAERNITGQERRVPAMLQPLTTDLVWKARCHRDIRSQAQECISTSQLKQMIQKLPANHSHHLPLLLLSVVPSISCKTNRLPQI